MRISWLVSWLVGTVGIFRDRKKKNFWLEPDFGTEPDFFFHLARRNVQCVWSYSHFECTSCTVLRQKKNRIHVFQQKNILTGWDRELSETEKSQTLYSYRPMQRETTDHVVAITGEERALVLSDTGRQKKHRIVDMTVLAYSLVCVYCVNVLELNV